MNISKRFTKYVSQNILGTLGVSCYIIADTFFIAQAGGVNGITILNLALPVISLVFAIGALLGVGGATEYAILKAQGNKRKDLCFSDAIMALLLVSIPFVVVGLLAPQKVLELMGGDAVIALEGANYMRLFLSFTPFFMLNAAFPAFVRNDNDPTIAMVATLASTLFNIVFDYIFVFPMKMGIEGAALATVVSPIISILICLLHFRKKDNDLHFHWMLPNVKENIRFCQLGFSSFVAEMANGITIMVLNFLILSIAGNIGVAAYGIVANIAIVVNAIYNGIAQGAQPLISECYGKGEKASLRKMLGLVSGTAFVSAVLIYIVLFLGADFFVSAFNSENSLEMAQYATKGMKLYFLGYFFAGLNIVLVGYLSAIACAKEAFVASILRGFIAIIAFAYILAYFLGFTGIWLSFLAAEAVTLVVVVVSIARYMKKQTV